MRRFLDGLFFAPEDPRGREPARAHARRSRPRFEALEDRRLLTVAAVLNLADGVLRIDGSDEAETIRIVNDRGDVRVEGVSITVVDGDEVVERDSTPRTGLAGVHVLARGGDDTVSVSEVGLAAGQEIGVVIHGGRGFDTLSGGSGADLIYGGAESDSVLGGAGDDIVADEPLISARLTGDFNGDGLADVASFGSDSGTWWVEASNGAGFDTQLWADFASNGGWGAQVPGDFNADGRTDIANYHPSNGTWWVSLSNGAGFDTQLWAQFATFGGWSAQVPGDFNGDGFTDVANFHPSNGTWWVSLSTGSGFDTQLWADFTTNSGWTAQVPGDFNGDGLTDLANFHPSNGTWWVSLSNGSGFDTALWADFATNSGWTTKVPGDFNGDGLTDLANFHPSNGTWWVALSTGAGFDTALWADYVTNSGWTSQLPGDFNGDGLTDLANFHPSNGTWWVSLSTGAGFDTQLWADYVTNSGWTSQLRGDFNGDGLTDLANFHPSNGTWWISTSTGAGFDTQLWDVEGNGDDTLYGGGGRDTVYGGAGGDTLWGDNDSTWSGDSDVLDGGAGDDLAFGGGGSDTLYGGEGNDFLFGNDGADYMRGDSGNDWMSGGDQVDNMGGGDGDDVLYGDAEVDYLHGDNGRDSLYGGAGNDRLYGGADDDDLYGGEGNDTLRGEDGDDGLFGGRGVNLLVGGNDDDRFLVMVSTATNSIADLETRDAVIRFVDTGALTNIAPPNGWPTSATNPYNFNAGVWTEAEIMQADQAFDVLRDLTNGTRLLELPNGSSYTFFRRGRQTSGVWTFGGQNDGGGNITIGQGFDATLNTSTLLETVYHEIGHAWDRAPANPYHQEFLDLSGWRRSATSPGAGFIASGANGDDWWYRDTAVFARPDSPGMRDSYSRLSPFEDFCTVWETYFMQVYHGATGNTRVAAKEAILHRLFWDLTMTQYQMEIGVIPWVVAGSVPSSSGGAGGTEHECGHESGADHHEDHAAHTQAAPAAAKSSFRGLEATRPRREVRTQTSALVSIPMVRDDAAGHEPGPVATPGRFGVLRPSFSVSRVGRSGVVRLRPVGPVLQAPSDR